MTPALGDRSLFPALEARAYLAHAAISAPSVLVTAAVEGLLADYARCGMYAFGGWMERREGLRARLAALVGGEPGEIGLVQSTTSGLSALALALPFRPGDRVILFEGEFPANVTPWQRAAERFGLTLDWVPLAPFHASDEEGLAALARALERPARLVAVSAVQFQTGLRMPLAAIARLAHAAGAELSVDAVQALGVVPLDARALGADYLACGAHKWLMGLEGAGFVWVRAERQAALRPLTAGWLGHEEGLRFLFEGAGHLRYDRPLKQDGSVFEAGNLSAASFAALDASLTALLALGVDRIEAHVAGYLDALEPALSDLGLRSVRAREPSRRSGILSFAGPFERKPSEIQRSLHAQGVIVSTPDGHLRFAPHFWSDPAEIPLVARAVREALRG